MVAESSTHHSTLFDSLFAPAYLWRLASELRGLFYCRSNDGCLSACTRPRTDDSRLPWDTNGSYGGWGGHEHHDTPSGVERPPVVFVHGNQRDACDWTTHADDLKDRGWLGDELWAITFRQPTATHDEMAVQLDAFVARICEETGVDDVAIVAHSLGVTGARYWMHREDQHDHVSTFVGLAGANHGTLLCSLAKRVRLTSGPYLVSPSLSADYDSESDHLLATLNRGDETPGDTAYYTLRGTYDPLFWKCRHSPLLDGANANVALTTDHDGVRTDRVARKQVCDWLAEDELTLS